jgi:outer membrane protein assembly factor BamB
MKEMNRGPGFVAPVSQQRRNRAAIVASMAIVLSLAVVSANDTWPQFRGADAGVAPDDPALPDTWSETENVLWKVRVPGLGWSSPVVWRDHIFVTSAVSDNASEEVEAVKGLYDPGDEFGKTKAAAPHHWFVHDIDVKTGKIRWSREMHAGMPPLLRHRKGSFASETPATDGERVYVFFGSIGLVAALDMNGRVVWKKDVGAYNGPQEFAPAASPILHGERLYVLNDNTHESFLVALDRKTGRAIWRVQREEVENWATPFVWENKLRTEIVTNGRRNVRSYDLNGKLLWQLTGMTANVVPTPFSKHGLVYLSSGYPGGNVRPVYAIRPGASGDISLKPGEEGNEYIAWFQPRLGTYQTSALVYGDYYYTLLDRGLLLCHDARTGKQMYGLTRISPEAAAFTASPWAYNGKVFTLSEDGDTFVVEAGPKFTLLGKNSLNEMALATPAVAHGSLFIRTQSLLYRIGRRTGQ